MSIIVDVRQVGNRDEVARCDRDVCYILNSCSVMEDATVRVNYGQDKKIMVMEEGHEVLDNDVMQGMSHLEQGHVADNYQVFDKEQIRDDCAECVHKIGHSFKDCVVSMVMHMASVCKEDLVVKIVNGAQVGQYVEALIMWTWVDSPCNFMSCSALFPLWSI